MSSPVFAPLDQNRRLAVPGARPYPWPYDGAASPATTALVVVAAQRAVASHCSAASATWETISVLATEMRQWGARVVWTRHARFPSTRRSSILPAAHGPERGPAGRRPGDLVVLAYGVDAFSASPLAEALSGYGVSHLLVAGFGLEGPVHSTLRSANDRGCECLLVSDGCAPLDVSLAGAAMSTVEMSGGIFGATASAEQVLAGTGGLWEG